MSSQHRRACPPNAGPYTFVWANALTVKLREDGRVAGVHLLIIVKVNANARREILGLDVAPAEDGAGWLTVLRGLVTCGLLGVQLVIIDVPPGWLAPLLKVPEQRTAVAAQLSPLVSGHWDADR